MTDTTEHKKGAWRDNFETLLIALIFLNFARIFVFQSFKIPTGSMIDNLLEGDHLFVNKAIFGNAGPPALEKLMPHREIKRGDIIVFRYPQDRTVDYVKRVIALPGETLQVRDKVVYINGQPLNEPYVYHKYTEILDSSLSLPEQYRMRDQYGPYVVPEGSYFAMGDNRDESYDSRYWGPVKRELIKGRPFMVYWSFKSARPYDPSLGGTLRGLLDVVLHFFTWTRWDRTFFIVDSRYHYPFQD
jgi:signal peptidase I